LLPIKRQRRVGYFAVFLILQSFLLSACASRFHLRENVALAKNYQRIQLEQLASDSDFAKIFEQTLETAGGELIKSDSPEYKTKGSNTIIRISNLHEGKRVVAYTRERKARIYLVFLKFDYVIKAKTAGRTGRKHAKQRISLDRTFVYDADFALGKAEEEKQIRDGLYAEASRLILLYLKPDSVRKP